MDAISRGQPLAVPLARAGALAHNPHPMTLRVQLSIALALSLAAGCAVGPDFKRPAPPQGADVSAHSLEPTTAVPKVPGGETQRFAVGAELSGDWWTLFHSQPLTALIDRSLAQNHDLKAAQAALKVAHETTLAQRGSYYPTATASLAASRQRQSGQIAPTLNSNAFLYNLFTPQVTVSYMPDVFGLNRRTVESLQAQEQEARYQMIAVFTTLTANVVVTAVR